MKKYTKHYSLEELIQEIIKLYKKAKKTSVSTKYKNISRGRSHNISSQTEDLFSEFIATLLPSDVEILVDQPFSYKLKGRSQTIFPDITIIKNDEIVNLFDIKMDLGWNRVFHPYCKEKAKLIKEIKTKSKSISTRVIKTKLQKTYSVNKDLKYNVVVVSNQNITESQRQNNNDIIKKIPAKDFNCFILTEGIHPNNYDKNKLKLIMYLENEFQRLIKEIKSI